jgi:hypothetical protein
MNNVKRAIQRNNMKNVNKWHKKVAQKVIRTWMNNAKRMKEQHKEHKGITNSKEEKHEKQEEQ